MFYNLGESQIPNVIYGCNEDFKCYLLAWSLTALLKLMPLYNGTTPRLAWSNGSYNCFYYQGYSVSNPNSLVDAAFEMVCWLIEQGHIKVNK
jgi:hypothetical protein